MPLEGIQFIPQAYRMYLKKIGCFWLFLSFINFSLPAWSIEDSLKKVATNLAKGIKAEKLSYVGVLIFPYHDGKLSSGSFIVCDKLTTYLVGFKYLRLVERRLIQKILEEQHLSESGVLDPDTTKKLGKVLGVEALVTGTLIELEGEETEINARALLANTGEIIAAERSVIKQSWNDRPKDPSRPSREWEEPEPEVKKTEAEPILIGYPAGRGGRRWRK